MDEVDPAARAAAGERARAAEREARAALESEQLRASELVAGELAKAMGGVVV